MSDFPNPGMSGAGLLGPLRIVFVGGGNMAGAIIAGLIRQGVSAAHIHVVDPSEAALAALVRSHGVSAAEQLDAQAFGADVVVWAVKPQMLREAIADGGKFHPGALHLSVVTGITCDVLARWLGTPRIVRCMPNTPALIGKGISALYAHTGVGEPYRKQAEQIVLATGDCLWLQKEEQLDAVTALSGAGPAYVFYFLEAMMAVGERMGLSAAQARALSIGTFAGASALADVSDETPQQLRARVTSKAGTTFAATTCMDDAGVKQAFSRAIEAAWRRAQELGQQYGADDIAS